MSRRDPINLLPNLDSTKTLQIGIYDKTHPTNVPSYNEVRLQGSFKYTYSMNDPYLPPPDDDDGDDEICPDDDCGDSIADPEQCPTQPVGCTSCSSYGSPRPSFNTATFNIEVKDTPVWQDTAVGPKLELAMKFSNFASTNARTSFGPKWACNWDSYLEVVNTATNKVRLPSGSIINFSASGGSWSPPGSLSGVMVLTNGNYEYRRSNGEVLRYSPSSGNTNLYLLSRMWDAWSNSVSITYTSDRIYRVTQVSPNTGRYLQFAYAGTNARAISVSTSTGALRTAYFHYNTSGFLTNAVDMSGFGYVYTYTNGFISGVFKDNISGLRRLGVSYSATPNAWVATNTHHITLTDSENRTDTYTWAYGLVIKDSGFNGVTNREFFNVSASPFRKAVVSSHINTRTVASRFGYNASERLVQRIDRTGAAWNYLRNAEHRVSSLQDPHGHVWSNVYAANGVDLLYQVPPDGPVQRLFTYVPNRHVVATETNALGETISYQYNQYGLLTNRFDGRMTEVYEYDAEGRLTARFRNSQLEQTNRYDAFGRRVWTMDAAGLVVTSSYDNLNRLRTETYINGSLATTRTIDYSCCFIDKITDRKGRETFFQYNDLGWKKEEESPSGLVTTWKYDRHGRSTVITNMLQWENRTYTDEGWLSRRELPARPYAGTHAENFFYDEEGRMIKKQGLAGEFYRYEFDVEGRQTASYVPDGRSLAVGVEEYVLSESNRYDALGREVWKQDIRGLVVSNSYNALGQILTTFYPDGSTEVWTYNQWGDTTSFKDRAGNMVSNVYDSLGRVTQSIDAKLFSTYTAYTNLDLISTVSNSLGQVWAYTYDAERRVTQVVHPDATTETMAYDPLGNVTQQVRGGVTTVIAYNELDRRVSVHVNGVLVESNRYDSLGRAVWSQDANGLVTTNAWDSWGEMMSRHWPGGLSETYQYGDRGLTNSMDRLGIPVRIVRDSLGRVVQQVDGATNAVSYAFVSNGVNQLRSLWDGNSNQTVWAYDMFGNMTNKTYADASRDRYQYDRLNRVTNKNDAANVSTKYGYDANGNLLSMQAGSNPQIAFLYDGLNRRTNMSDGVGTTRWTFDSMNRIKSESGPFGTTVALGYDALNRMTSISFSGYTWSYHYDALGRVTNMVTHEGIYRLGYLAQGTRKASVIYPNGVTAAMHYDSLIRMTNLAYSVGATNLLSIRYGYDNGDRRTSEVWGDGRSLTYAYDRAHQLLDSVSTSRASDNASYRYDKAGNPRRRSELGFVVSNGFNNLNQIVVGVWTGGAVTVAGAINFNAGTVTVNGVTANRFGLFYEKTNVSLVVGTNIITAVYRGPAFTNSAFIATARTEVVVGNSSYGHDANGNLTNDANFIYRYDAMNQLTNVVTMQGGTDLLANRYDGLGRRVQATTDGTNIVRYVYLPGTFLVLATLDATNGVKEVFTHGPDLSGSIGGAGGIGGILSQTKHQGQSTPHFLHTDSMGNVVLTTDASGLESSSYRYTPFGRLLGKSGSFISRFTFSSKEFDAKTGLGYWGYRFFSPQLGRWLSRDPIEEVGGNNLYLSLGNLPTTYLDHLGLFLVRAHAEINNWKDALEHYRSKAGGEVSAGSRLISSILNSSGYKLSKKEAEKERQKDLAKVPCSAQSGAITIRPTKPIGFYSGNNAVGTLSVYYEPYQFDWTTKPTKESCVRVVKGVGFRKASFRDKYHFAWYYNSGTSKMYLTYYSDYIPGIIAGDGAPFWIVGSWEDKVEAWIIQDCRGKK